MASLLYMTNHGSYIPVTDETEIATFADDNAIMEVDSSEEKAVEHSLFATKK